LEKDGGCRHLRCGPVAVARELQPLVSAGRKAARAYDERLCLFLSSRPQRVLVHRQGGVRSDSLMPGDESGRPALCKKGKRQGVNGIAATGSRQKALFFPAKAGEGHR
jgi:hypothetical protein